MKNQGISLITLIITIIVIIILAAIVLYNGFNAPNAAQFARFTQDYDNVTAAVLNKYSDLVLKHSISVDTRSEEQIYLEIALGADQGQYSTMFGTTNHDHDEFDETIKYGGPNNLHIQNIAPDVAKTTGSINMALPKVRESQKAWYITEDGRVFNATGYIYDGKTYFTGAIFAKGQLKNLDDYTTDAGTNLNRALKIWDAISGDNSITDISSSVTVDD